MDTIQQGGRSQAVRIMQYLLGATPDGVFGPKTLKSVLAFQKANGLKEDGICGPKTWAALATAQKTIRQGASGNPVKAIQDALNITIDGKFGPQTEKAVRTLQNGGGLKLDGIVGPATWGYLLTVYKLPAASGGGGNPAIQPVDYKQYDARWRNVMYSNHNDPAQTIKNSGCGPTALANILARWYGVAITPVQVAQMAVEGGYRTYSSGTARAFFDWAAKKFECSKFERTTSTAKVENALSAGAYVIALMGKGYWTGGGHYITCWKYDASLDRIYANDPASSTRKYASASSFDKERKEYFIFFK